MPKKKNIDIWHPSVPVEKNFHNWEGEPILHGPARKAGADSLTVVDLFAGCGGFSQGFRTAGFESVFAVDIHRPSVETFRRNHPTAAVVLGDMRKLTDSQIEASIPVTSVDVVTAGVPCQGFSLNNRKRWDNDDRNFLFKEFIRVINLLKPKVVLLENVSGLQMAANGAFKREIAGAIGEAGYDVDVNVLNAVEHGVPQKRIRVFFMGARPGFEIRWPKATHGPGLKPYVGVWDAIGDLPTIQAGESADEYKSAPVTPFQKLMRGSSKDLLNHIAPSHPDAVIKKIGRTPPGDPMYPRFKQRIRLHPDRPSPTQVSGGIRPQFQFGHPTSARGLTIRERCRIQSFPDHYFICGGIVQGRVQTGNAVPPLLANAIARQIAGLIRGQPFAEDSLGRGAQQVELFA